MSGGYFNYLDSQLKSEIFGWTNRYSNVFEDKQISALVWDILDLIHEFDWYKSGDNGKDTYLKAKNDFKKKYYKPRLKFISNIINQLFRFFPSQTRVSDRFSITTFTDFLTSVFNITFNHKTFHKILNSLIMTTRI